MQIGDDLKERKMYGKPQKQQGKNRENSSKHKRTKKGDDREAARGRVRK
jgi:hypothetical protein